MRITIVCANGNIRSKPQAGDRRTTKKHGLQIRVQCMSRNPNGTPRGRMVSNGRPVFDWRRPDQLDEWDLHHLTQVERDALDGIKSLRKDIENSMFMGDAGAVPTQFAGLRSVTSGGAT